MRETKLFKDIQPYLVAAGLVAFAAVMRLWPLHTLENKLAWLTFYPAVMAAAVYGGLGAGVIASIFSSLIVVFFWTFLVPNPFIQSLADWLGLFIFTFNCFLISLIAESTRRANARAKKAQIEAESSNRAKSVFLASMSHELRTPLNAILGFSEMMSTALDIPEEHRKTLNIVNKSGKNLLKLINDVLDMAKVESGRIVVENTSVNLAELIGEVITLMQLSAKAKNIQLLLERSETLTGFVSLDATKIRQILINIIGNAIRCTDKGEVVLRVNLQPTERTEQVTLIIEVEDTGVGIAEEDKKRIFEPFVQIGSQEIQKGTGLGLAITKKLIEAMGGSIELESTLGIGSTFSIKISCRTVKQSEIGIFKMEHPRVECLVAGQPEYRILIVEDQAENWLLLKSLLDKAGFKTQVAENGKKGVEIFELWHPHFIWMDIRMHGLDGIETAKRIRQKHGGKDVKIVALTASVFKEESDKIIESGMDGIVGKPFLSAEIFECMKKHLNLQYVYKEVVVGRKEDKALEGTVVSFFGVPDAIIGQLKSSLVALDIEGIDKVVCEIKKVNPKLGDTLAEYSKQYDYTNIALLLEKRTSDD